MESQSDVRRAELKSEVDKLMRMPEPRVQSLRGQRQRHPAGILFDLDESVKP